MKRVRSFGLNGLNGLCGLSGLSGLDGLKLVRALPDAPSVDVDRSGIDRLTGTEGGLSAPASDHLFWALANNLWATFSSLQSTHFSFWRPSHRKQQRSDCSTDVTGNGYNSPLRILISVETMETSARLAPVQRRRRRCPAASSFIRHKAKGVYILCWGNLRCSQCDVDTIKL